MHFSYNEFHINKDIRDGCNFSESLFTSTGNVIITSMKNIRLFTEKLNTHLDKLNLSEKRVSAGQINAMGLIDEILHYVSMLYRRDKDLNAFQTLLSSLENKYTKEKIDELLIAFNTEFPPTEVYKGKLSVKEYLSKSSPEKDLNRIRSNREATLEEMIMLILANENPAFKPFAILFNDKSLSKNPLYSKIWKDVKSYFKTAKTFGPFNHDFITFLKEPVAFSPDSLKGQLDYIQKNWMALIGIWLKRLLAGMDTLSEEEKAAWHPTNGSEASMPTMGYENLMNEYERFSADSNWMPKVVLMAKTVLVWLDQLTKKYKRPITRLDQIPDEELDALAQEGFTGLWLIGLWSRSTASKRIKQICGNPEAAASAYSLYDYNIADNLGGWSALENLRERLWKRGVRLASDMVPNHTGMDSDWVINHPDRFVQRRDNPFPQYSYNGENLSHDGRVGVYLEDHYYAKSDCAVTFKRVDNATGDTRYIYHGNDGTGMPWNDTAQIDFLNPEAREAVMQEILHVARNFPIIRFDAAMVLAKKHIRRLWYPEQGHGGDIATRSEYALSRDDFEKAIPEEFWREVVDRVAREVPDTLLLAEAFWMMEGYFVRTLGMHRVYNSAFMNMLKKEENQKYRDSVKNTLNFDPQVLKRFVNFMNNPDEETAVAQFGKGDKYFGVCTLMITMPGLPMFGHGQIEGFEEKYGMEYTKAYKDEQVDTNLLERHKREIFPLMHKRALFAQIEDFLFYDVWNNGVVNENVFAYSNCFGGEKAVVFYNNKYENAAGWIKQSCTYAVKNPDSDDIQMRTRSLSEGLSLTAEDDKYCIFREHKSNLWFVRKSSDICEHGMFISLQGFETQIFMDIHQVSDTIDHKYKILNESLNGRGTYDLEIEWQEICYKDLYTALMEFTTADFFRTACTLFEKATAKQITDFTKSLKERAVTFYKEATVLNSENVKTSLKSAEKQFTTFEKLFKQTASIYTKAKNKKLPLAKGQDKPDYIALLQKYAKSDDFVSFIATGLGAKYIQKEILIACCVVFALDDSSIALTCSLYRKLNQAIITSGIPEASQYVKLQKLFTLLPTAKTAYNGKNKKGMADLAELLAISEYSSLLFGANDFNNVRWFNKELSDEALFLSALEPILTGVKTLKEYTNLVNAKAKAEYKCFDFCEKFVSKKVPAKTAKSISKTAKKVAIKKPAKTAKEVKTTSKPSKPATKASKVVKKPTKAVKAPSKTNKTPPKATKPATKTTKKPAKSVKKVTKKPAIKASTKTTTKKK